MLSKRCCESDRKPEVRGIKQERWTCRARLVNSGFVKTISSGILRAGVYV